MLAAIQSSKRSILYDLEKKINDLKCTLLASRTMEVPDSNIGTIKDELGELVPVKTMQEFLSFEKAIATTQEKKKALVKTLK